MSTGDLNSTVSTHAHENWVKKYGWKGILSTVVLVKDLNIDSWVWTTSSFTVDPANPVMRLGLPNLSIHEVNFRDLQDGGTVVMDSVLKSGLVQFFSLLGLNQNCNWFWYIHRLQKARPNCTQLVVCGSVRLKSQFWLTRPWLVVMWLESVRTNFHVHTYYLYIYYILNWIKNKPIKKERTC